MDFCQEEIYYIHGPVFMDFCQVELSQNEIMSNVFNKSSCPSESPCLQQSFECKFFVLLVSRLSFTNASKIRA